MYRRDSMSRPGALPIRGGRGEGRMPFGGVVMSRIRGWTLAGLAVLVPMWSGCSKGGPSGPGDTTPPAQTTTLAAGSPTTGSITLTWTAPGDDGTTGRASHYDIRYSTLALNQVTWTTAHQVASPPAPRTA